MSTLNAILVALCVTIIVFSFIGVLAYYEDKQYQLRYARIKHKMKPKVKYPLWRLEEMLKEEELND